MDKNEQAIFEAYAVLDAHVSLLQRILHAQHDNADLITQTALVAQAQARLTALPRPPKQVAKAA